MKFLVADTSGAELLARMTPSKHPFYFIKSYACVQLLSRCIYESSWKHPHAAFKHEMNCVSILEKLDYLDFDRNFFESSDYPNIFNEIYDMLQGMSLMDFMRDFLPDFITQPDRAFNILEKVHLIEYKCLALILAKMDWMNNFGSSFKFESYEKKVRNIFSDEEWEGLVYTVNCYAFDYSSAVKKAAHDAHKIFEEYNCSEEYQIALYGDVREILVGSWTGKHRSWQSNITNGAHYIRKAKIQNPKIDALAMDSAINKAAERIGNIERPTDFLQAVLVDASNNDSKIENDFVFSKFVGRLSDDDMVAIINPSPDFLCQYPERFMEKTTFVVPYEPMAWVLSQQFLTARFVSFDEFGCDGIHVEPDDMDFGIYSKVLMFSRQLSDEQEKRLVYGTVNTINNDGVFLAVLPSGQIAGEIWPVFDIAFKINKIDLLPQKAFNSVPKKKVLVEAKLEAKKENIQITDYEFFRGADGKTYLTTFEEPVFLSPKLLSKPKSIYTIYREQTSGSSAESRKHPHSVAFTPDICFWYTVARSPKTFGHKVEAYTCYLPTETQRKRRLFSRGRKVKGAYASVSRLSDQEDVEIWCESILPYKPRIHQGVVEAFKKSEGQRLLIGGYVSLKTLWYLQLNVEKMCDDPKTRAERELFSSFVGTLQLNADREDFAERMECFCEGKTIEETAMYWNTLYGLIGYAVKNGYLKDNPVEEYALAFREKRDAAMAVVRAALMKKTFRTEEERRLLDYLFGVIPEKGEYISVLIRFFTGLEPNIVSALTWGDIHAVAHTEIHQFWIYQQFKNNGEEPVPLENGEDYRRIPIVPTLYTKLQDRLKDIKKKTGLTAKDLKKVQLIASDDQLMAGEKAKKITPRKINSLSKKAVGAIGIQEIIVDLPDMKEETGTKETNLTSYRGDIFRANFRYRAIECGLTDSEIRYILGLCQTSPFGKNYCDYLNSFSQLAMYLKLCRWDVVHGGGIKTKSRRTSISLPCDVSLPSGHTRTRAIFEISVAKQTGPLSVQIESMHGFHVQAGLITNDEEGMNG